MQTPIPRTVPQPLLHVSPLGHWEVWVHACVVVTLQVPVSSASPPSGRVAQVESPQSSLWPISKSNDTFGANASHGTTFAGAAVAYSARKVNGVVVQSVWLALCTKPLAALATMKPVDALVTSLTSVRRPLDVSVIVTTMVSPLDIRSCVPPVVPSVVTYCCVVGSMQFSFWNAVLFWNVLMCSRAHHWV